MRLRYLFILTFCLVTLVPLSLFWMWPYSKALESEIDDVKERHLVIAKNLSGAFERYYQDVTSLFTALSPQLSTKELQPEIKNLLKIYGFETVLLISTKTGEIKNCLFDSAAYCPKKIAPHILKLIPSSIEKNKTILSVVTQDSSVNSGPILLAIKKMGEDIVLGYLSTEYIIKMGKKVAFGEKGHAAIVDQEGNILSHPLDSWIKSRKNISKVSAVQKMLKGETGVEVFYSPALKSDMIAGYTVVPNANWGVMVPQPFNELKNKAKEIDETAMLVMLLGLGLALVITIPISFLLIQPLEKLSQVIKSIEKGNFEVDVQLNISKFFPSEIKDLKRSFTKMMEKLQENKKAISQLAYIDTITGLPNRNYFHKIATQSLKKMKLHDEKGAVVFIDFNKFKGINDTHGHRAGDEILNLFAQRIMKHFSVWDEDKKSFLNTTDTLPNNIPARLSGDEFVVLLRNIGDKSEIEIKIKELEDDIFSDTYILYGNIEVNLTGSIGIALFPEDGENYNEILKSADIAMYKAKNKEENHISFFND